MRKSFSPEEVNSIENTAYDLGFVIGAREERERIISVIQNMETRTAMTDLGACVWTKHVIDAINGLSSARESSAVN